jgi:hypothetical protein
MHRCTWCPSLCPHRQSRGSQRDQGATYSHHNFSYWQARSWSQGQSSLSLLYVIRHSYLSAVNNCSLTIAVTRRNKIEIVTFSEMIPCVFVWCLPYLGARCSMFVVWGKRRRSSIQPKPHHGELDAWPRFTSSDKRRRLCIQVNALESFVAMLHADGR